MSSTSPTTDLIPFRTFTAPEKYGGAPLALGCSHSSWFLVFSRPYGMRMKRAVMCLNFIDPADHTTIGGISPDTGKSRFTVGGRHGEYVIESLLALRDQEGHRPVTVVHRYPADHARRLLAVLEVEVPDIELIHACARCGRWEAMRSPRFLRCGGCKKRYYCSEKCQKDDWKPAYHKGECGLLKEGKDYEVENKRKLHDNNWFDNDLLGNDDDDDMYGRAMNDGDYNYLAYGKRSRPRDVPSPAGSRPPINERNIPDLPPLPQVAGFVPTGDTMLDEMLLFDYIAEHGTEAQLEELDRVLDQRWGPADSD
ncbi:hypothetical protein L226DRAFT_608647 [Lentinus tigrinus ALCF2SS1-7]|uniref:MYND-type domain-containing protein n=1 Tax=Lentinus tigrinus ALCF2SS1-6 TaxID=1328759 RepID=A0A5C2SXX9_9APHY|nr:hypothetical protein L227DRAFT_569609 [Lentinus tigrinus ALCF2SS1-6]RPD81417.1 hypothetical protein L226DRAFT_608647 [Lentinus tigrinus ALCF2SS1-7]